MAVRNTLQNLLAQVQYNWLRIAVTPVRPIEKLAPFNFVNAIARPSKSTKGNVFLFLPMPQDGVYITAESASILASALNEAALLASKIGKAATQPQSLKIVYEDGTTDRIEAPANSKRVLSVTLA